MSDKKNNSIQPPPPGADSADYVDRREQFEKLALNHSPNPEAEREFLASKIELIRSDPNLSDEEKDRAIADLQPRLLELTKTNKPKPS